MRMGSKSVLTGLFQGRNDYEYTRLGAQVQNVQDKTVYVFGEGDVCEDEVVEFEMSSIRSRESNRSKKKEKEKPLYVERHIAEGDTLQSLCLLYGCPVAEMKRVNNLINDQDFYALTRIKVPVKHNSFLIEQIEKDSEKIIKSSSNPQLNGAAASYIDSEHEYGHSPESDLELTTDLSDPDTQNEVIRKISINKAARSNSSEAQKFLQNMDKDLSKIMKSKKTSKHSLDEVISVLTNKSVNPLVTKKSVNTWTDLSVYRIAAIVLCVIVTIIVPILICIYIFTQDKL